MLIFFEIGKVLYKIFINVPRTAFISFSSKKKYGLHDFFIIRGTDFTVTHVLLTTVTNYIENFSDARIPQTAQAPRLRFSQQDFPIRRDETVLVRFKLHSLTILTVYILSKSHAYNVLQAIINIYLFVCFF